MREGARTYVVVGDRKTSKFISTLNNALLYWFKSAAKLRKGHRAAKQ